MAKCLTDTIESQLRKLDADWQATGQHLSDEALRPSSMDSRSQKNKLGTSLGVVNAVNSYEK